MVQIQNLRIQEKGVTMAINRAELIEELENNIRKYGGAFGEWCVGTAKDARGPFFQRHLAANLGDGLAYREAFTTTAAAAVVDHLVNHRGLQRDPEGSGQSAVGTQAPQAEPDLTSTESAGLKPGATMAADAVSEPGKIVFVYRRTRDKGYGARDTEYEIGKSGVGVGDSRKAATAPPAPASEHAAFLRRAA
jgi:hypothetical protein